MHLHAVSFALHSLFQHRNGVGFMHVTAVHAVRVLAQRWSLGHLTGESAGHEQFLADGMQVPSQHRTLGLGHDVEHSLAELAHWPLEHRTGLFWGHGQSP